MGKDTKKDDDGNIDVKEVHMKLLDDLVNVNSLMTLAVFVGLTMATPKIRGLESRDECHAGPKEAKMLILYEVIAFSCFFLSSMVAKVLKLYLYLDGADDRYPFTSPNIDLKELMIALSACSSIAGIISVSLSIVKIVEVRIGLLSCGCKESIAAVLCLGILVGFALLIYVVSMAIAVYASFKSDHAKDKGNENKKGEA